MNSIVFKGVLPLAGAAIEVIKASQSRIAGNRAAIYVSDGGAAIDQGTYVAAADGSFRFYCEDRVDIYYGASVPPVWSDVLVSDLPDQLKDSNFRISNAGDKTKQIAFDVSGIAAGQVRTVGMPDSSGEMMLREVPYAITDLGNDLVTSVDLDLAGKTEGYFHGYLIDNVGLPSTVFNIVNAPAGMSGGILELTTGANVGTISFSNGIGTIDVPPSSLVIILFERSGTNPTLFLLTSMVTA